jgi:hypothetical protein
LPVGLASDGRGLPLSERLKHRFFRHLNISAGPFQHGLREIDEKK